MTRIAAVSDTMPRFSTAQTAGDRPMASSPALEMPARQTDGVSSLAAYAHDPVAWRHSVLHASAQSLPDAGDRSQKSPEKPVTVLSVEAAARLAGKRDCVRMKVSLPQATDEQLIALTPLIARLESCELWLDCTALTIAGLNRARRELRGMTGDLTVHFQHAASLPDVSLRQFADALGLVFSRQGERAWMSKGLGLSSREPGVKETDQG